MVWVIYRTINIKITPIDGMFFLFYYSFACLQKPLYLTFQ